MKITPLAFDSFGTRSMSTFVETRAGRKKGIKVQTAAEFAGKPVEMLEARRKELYQKFPNE